MKRNLLTLVFITLLSLTAGAQTVCKSHKELPKRIDSEIVDIDLALFKTQLIQPEPVCKAMDDDSYLSKQKHLFVKGADTPYTEGTEKLPLFPFYRRGQTSLSGVYEAFWLRCVGRVKSKNRPREGLGTLPNGFLGDVLAVM